MALSPLLPGSFGEKTTQVLQHLAHSVMDAGPKQHSKAMEERFSWLIMYEKVLIKKVFCY